MAKKNQTRQRMANTQGGKNVVNGYNYGIVNYGPFTQNVNYRLRDFEDFGRYENIPYSNCVGDHLPSTLLMFRTRPGKKRKPHTVAEEVPSIGHANSSRNTTAAKPTQSRSYTAIEFWTSILGITAALGGYVACKYLNNKL